ncbi:putative uncharacterized protein [Firmicutes bacterium CAG:114]|nr:putative uncharacterized protein [Firmicutes bacterium CAG:114]
MDFIPLNIVSGYRGSVAAGRNFWEGKHQNNSHIPVSDAIVALYQDETARITSVFLTTKRLDDFGITKHETLTLVLRVPTSHAPATVNSILAVVNGFFRFMGWKDIAVKLLKIQKALFCDERRELTRAEYARLVSAAQKVGNERLSLVMQTICATGTRVSELRFITVEAVTTGRAEICNKGKRRTVFLPGRLRRLLRKYLQKQKKTAGAVFTTRTGRPLDRSNIWRDMKALCESADVEPGKVFPLNLRHLFARTYYSLEKDLSRIADILGHSSVNTTRIYTVESGGVHQRQLERMGLIIT